MMLKQHYKTTHGVGAGAITSLLFAFILGAASCKKDPEPEDKPDFNRAAMLAQMADNVIIPALTDYQSKVAELQTEANTFSSSTTQSNLATLENALNKTYLAWARVSTFEFGPASDKSLRSNTNTFPTDTAEVESNIQSASYTLAAANNIDAKGLPALDWLLYGSKNDLSYFTTDPIAANRKQYLNDVIAAMKSDIDYVVNQWAETGGDYRATFITADGTDVGSSVGQLINQLNFDLEILKNARLGIPLGKKSLGTPKPDKSEFYFGELSATIAREHAEALENIYLGAAGQGFDDYLIHLEASYNSGLLDDVIKTQFVDLQAALAGLPDPLAEQASAQSQALEDAYQETKELVTLLKTDMPSALSVLITYQDNDGD